MLSINRVERFVTLLVYSAEVGVTPNDSKSWNVTAPAGAKVQVLVEDSDANEAWTGVVSNATTASELRFLKDLCVDYYWRQRRCVVRRPCCC